MISKGTKLYVCMLSYVPCQVIIYLSVTQNLFCHELFICYTRYSVTYCYTCYTLQICHVKLSMPSVTCISCHVIFIVTCYAMLRNVVCYMVCHVMKCCMLHVWHVMKCTLLHLCPNYVMSVFLSSRHVTLHQDFCLFVSMSSRLEYSLYISRTILLSYSCQSRP